MATSATTMHATPKNSHMTWLTARSGAKRVTNAIPVPDNANTKGRMAGSAPGANLRTAMWAMMNAAKTPTGTPSVFMLSDCPWFRAIIANSSTTSGAATHRRTSSMLRRVMTLLLCWGVWGVICA